MLTEDREESTEFLADHLASLASRPDSESPSAPSDVPERWPTREIIRFEVTQADVSLLVDEVVDAWNSHDMRRFSGQFVVDADFVNVVGMWWQGRDEIERAHAAMHEGAFRNSTLAATLAAYKEVAPTIAVAHVTWELDRHGPSGPSRTTDTRRGIWTWVLRETEDRPQIVASQNTDISFD